MSKEDQSALWEMTQMFLTQLNMFARAKRWTFDSVLAIANVMLSHKQQHTLGNTWNAFQALYNKNLDPDKISPQQYIWQTVRPAYQTLIQKKGGEDSSTWRTFTHNLIIEHGKIKGQFAKDVKTSACHIQKQSMKVFKTHFKTRSWQLPLSAFTAVPSLSLVAAQRVLMPSTQWFVEQPPWWIICTNSCPMGMCLSGQCDSVLRLH